MNAKELSILIRSLERSPTDHEIQQLIDEVVNSGSMTRCNILFLSILNSNR